ncbi:MAG: hypothetical protein EB127_29760 [Alphaproteobacteria bacterium]|nr:hypothetical protein [Alphaproteobacteria bacterium]
MLKQINSPADFSASISSLGPNDPCMCGSGVKHKKCCLAKKTMSPFFQHTSESYTITTESPSARELQYGYSDMSQEDANVLKDRYSDMRNKPDIINSEDCEYFK